MTTKQSGQYHFTRSGVCHKVVGRGAPNAIRVRMRGEEMRVRVSKHLPHREPRFGNREVH